MKTTPSVEFIAALVFRERAVPDQLMKWSAASRDIDPSFVPTPSQSFHLRLHTFGKKPPAEVLSALYEQLPKVPELPKDPLILDRLVCLEEDRRVVTLAKTSIPESWNRLVAQLKQAFAPFTEEGPELFHPQIVLGTTPGRTHARRASEGDFPPFVLVDPPAILHRDNSYLALLEVATSWEDPLKLISLI